MVGPNKTNIRRLVHILWTLRQTLYVLEPGLPEQRRALAHKELAEVLREAGEMEEVCWHEMGEDLTRRIARVNADDTLDTNLNSLPRTARPKAYLAVLATSPDVRGELPQAWAH